jgi:protein-disulfide isomerase
MSKLALWMCIAAAIGCTKQESPLEKSAALGDAMSSMQRPGVVASSGGGGPVEDRLARVERKLQRVATELDRALGPAKPDPSTVYSVPISADDPVEGPADAKVTIVEAFEFLCPYCAMVNPTIDKIMQTYPKDVRIAYKYIVIHGQPAIAAAQIACAAHKQGKFTPVKAALWAGLFQIEEGRPKLQEQNANVDAMKKLAVSAGADAAKLDADLAGCNGWLQSSSNTLRPLAVNSTPSFFVNGRFIQTLDFAEFDAIIKEELAKADKAIADGVPQAEYYAREIVAKGAKQTKGRFED